MKKSMTRKNFTATLILMWLLAGATSQSKATTWTFDLAGLGTGGTTPWTTNTGAPNFYNGVVSMGENYSNALAQSYNGNPAVYFAPTSIQFGEVDTFFLNNSMTLDIFNAAADFNFKLHSGVGTNGGFHSFAVTGILTGTLNDSQSNVIWNLTGFNDTDSSTETVNTSAFLPNTSIPAWKLTTVIDGKPIAIWIIVQLPMLPVLFPNILIGYIADAPAPVTVSGVIFLQSVVHSVQPLIFTFRPAMGSSFTRTATLDQNGSYSLRDIPPDTYTVSIKGGRWLRKNITVDARTGNVTNANAVLFAGDANNDNAVDVADLILIINHYNQQKNTPANNSNYLEAADFDCDDVNDVNDLLLVIGNYNKQGNP